MKPRKSHNLDLSDEEFQLIEALKENPEMLEQFSSITQKFNQEVEGGMDAHQAECHVIKSIQEIGRSMISKWAQRTQTEAVSDACKSDGIIKHGKKKLYWFCTLGKIVFETQVVRDKSIGLTSYPFFEKAKLCHSNSSLLLGRRVVDISSERSYGKTTKAIVEHYGFELPTSAIAKITNTISQEAKEFNADAEGLTQDASTIVAQMDGSMVPIVQYSEASQEQKVAGLKKDRDCHWREVRLCSASLPENGSKLYGVVLGSPPEAGCMMSQTCQQLGMSGDTYIHGVGDGAVWIADQYEVQFGMNHDYYLDFYHACEYLAEASKCITQHCSSELTSIQWLSSAKMMLKEGRSQELIEELKGEMNREDPECAVAKAHQYLSNRAENLNYPKAIQAGLPIGSGEVESGHRSVLQARLKKPGAWWSLDNAENMAHLKVLGSSYIFMVLGSFHGFKKPPGTLGVGSQAP